MHMRTWFIFFPFSWSLEIDLQYLRLPPSSCRLHSIPPRVVIQTGCKMRINFSWSLEFNGPSITQASVACPVTFRVSRSLVCFVAIEAA